MARNDKARLEQALGLELTEVRLDWPAFKAQFGLSYDTEEDEANDAWFFMWQKFRGDHIARSCLLDEEGYLLGLILRETDLTEIVLPELPRLVYACISGNERLRTLQWAGATPQLQYLDASTNALATMRVPAGMDQLYLLNLSGNRLRELKLEGQLTALEELDLARNQIKNWQARLVDQVPNLIYLYLDGNPLNESVTTYREEREDNNYLPSLRKLRAAFGEHEGDGREENLGIKNEEYKLLVVGDGKAGKSCLVHRLITGRFKEEWDSTHGIAVERFEDEKDIYNFPYILNIWDFGGQDIYHTTHRLFMHTNATYLLLWNWETEGQDHIVQKRKGRSKPYTWKNRKLHYWLKYIHNLGRGSSVVVAQTRSAPRDPQPHHPMEQQFREWYAAGFVYLSPFLDIEAKEPEPKPSGYQKLVRELEDAIDEHQREEWLPSHWVAIREELDAMKPIEQAATRGEFMSIAENTLDYEDFIALAQDRGEAEPDLVLRNWLVPTGVVFYKHGLFDNKIILNQAWAIRAVYILFDRGESGYYEEISKAGGHFGTDILDQAWADYGPAERTWFLDFMINAEMVFEVSKRERYETVAWADRRFIAIEMLKEAQTPSFAMLKDMWHENKQQALCHLTYRHSFLYYGIMQAFIARTYAFADEVVDIYRNGIILNVRGTRALIEAQEDETTHTGEVRVTVPRHGLDVLFHIQKEFADIHGTDVEQLVRVDDLPDVKLSVLQNCREDEEIPQADGQRSVSIAPYKVFLPKREEAVDSLSEELRKRKVDDKYLAAQLVNAYPSEPIIKVPMTIDSAPFHSFSDLSGKIKLLFTAASPIDAGQMNTGLESRFEDLMNQFDRERKFEFHGKHGLSTENFRFFSVDVKPHILHFSGHGEQEGLVMEGKELGAKVLALMVKQLRKYNLRLVVLNACASLPMAKEVARYVPYVIGMRGPVPDATAIAFSRGFYQSLATGASVEEAFEWGIIAITDENTGGADIPVLVKGIPPSTDS